MLIVRDRGEEATFVFEEIAHPRPAGQHKLSHILDDLGLLLGGESGEPLGEALCEKLGQSGGPQASWRNGVGDEGVWAHHFALPGQEDEVTRDSVRGS